MSMSRRYLARLLVPLSLLAVAFAADAARKTPSTRLSNQAMTSGAHTLTGAANIPAGTTTIDIGICYYNDTGPESTARPTLVKVDGQTATFVAGAGSNSTHYAALYRLNSGFTTGSSKNVEYTLSATGNYFILNIGLEYRDGTATYGASAAAAAASPGPATTSAIANTSGDELIAFYCTKDNFGSPPTAGTGQSKLDEVDDTSGGAYYGFTTETATGTSDAQSIGAGGTANIPAIAAHAVTFSTAGAPSSALGGAVGGIVLRGSR